MLQERLIALEVGVHSASIERKAGLVPRIPVHPHGKAGSLGMSDVAVCAFHHSVVHKGIAFDSIVHERVVQAGIDIELGGE